MKTDVQVCTIVKVMWSVHVKPNSSATVASELTDKEDAKCQLYHLSQEKYDHNSAVGLVSAFLCLYY